MNLFKAFLKVLNENKFIIILYTLILLFFGAFNFKNSDTNGSFVSSKPDVLIVNNDSGNLVSNNLVNYISERSNIIDIDNNSDKINDALFYRDVNYIIYIPAFYGDDFLKGNNPEIEVKSTGDYQSSLAEMELSRYLKVANIYLKNSNNPDELIKYINGTLSNEANVTISSKLNTTALDKISYFYNFANYSILAGAIYVICLIVSSFKSKGVLKRTIVSSTDYKAINKKLLIANGLFAFCLWLFYVLMSFILIGNVMFSMHGLLCVINSFIFTFCALCIAFLLSSIVSDKNAINGIVNVIALGSSFLCGAFVPAEFLPNSVLVMAHILPSYYYISSNEIITSLEVLNLKTLKPVIINMLIVIIFSVIFIVISNMISKNKQKIG